MFECTTCTNKCSAERTRRQEKVKNDRNTDIQTYRRMLDKAKTLTLAITFLSVEMGLAYCTCVLLVTGPLMWYHTVLPCDLEL